MLRLGIDLSSPLRRRLFRVVGAAGDRGSRLPTDGVAPLGRIVYLFFLLAVWVVGGLLCVVEFVDWSSAVRGGVGLSHNGDADGRVHFPRISCGLSMFEVRSALWVKEEVGLELRFVHQQPDGRRRLDWRRKTNSIVSRDLVVISISFRAFPARKGCTVLPLVLI